MAYSEVETVGAVEVLVVYYLETASTCLVVFDLSLEEKPQVGCGCRCLMEQHTFESGNVEVAARNMMFEYERALLAWNLHIQRQHGHIEVEGVG